jgi:hypothetical protein
MEKWRRIWREGIAPQLSRSALLALQSALRRDDRRLLQGLVTAPPPLEANGSCAVVGGCAIGLCGWLGEDLTSVGAVEEYFSGICKAADAAFAEPAACRFFFNWFDEAPRAEMRRELLIEVTRALQQRTPIAA